jgi:hypothetical protein
VKENRPFAEPEKDRQTIAEIVTEHNQNIRNDNLEKPVLEIPIADQQEDSHNPEEILKSPPQTQAQAHEIINIQPETGVSNLAPIVEQDQEHEQGQGQIKTTPVKEKDEELDPEKKKKKKGIIKSFLNMFKSEGEIKLPNNDRKSVSSTVKMSTDLRKNEKVKFCVFD